MSECDCRECDLERKEAQTIQEVAERLFYLRESGYFFRLEESMETKKRTVAFLKELMEGTCK